MQCISVVLFLLLTSASIAVCSANKGSYLKHVNLLKQYPCKEPQPRVFELDEILDKELLNDLTTRGLRKFITPSVTILHRCESSGCCKDPSERCMPDEASIEDVTLTFANTHENLIYHQQTVKNHRKCVCRIMDKTIK